MDQELISHMTSFRPGSAQLQRKNCKGSFHRRMDIEYFPQRSFLPTRQDHLNHFYRNFEIKKKSYLEQVSYRLRVSSSECSPHLAKI